MGSEVTKMMERLAKQPLLITANKDLLDALHYMPANTEQEYTARGAVLHALDGLEELAGELGIDGFMRPD